MREPMRITWDTSEADAVYEQMCDLAHGRLYPDELYHAARSLLALALSKMEPAQREMTYGTLEPYLADTIGKLDALNARKKLNGHGPKGGLVI